MRFGKSIVLAAVAAGLAVSGTASASVIVLRNGWDPVTNVADSVNGYTGTRDDAGISSVYSAENLSDNLYAGRSGGTKVATVVGFDLSQYAPQIGTLTSATLEMTLSQAPWFTGATFSARNPTEQWTEGGAYFYKTPSNFWNPEDITNVTWDAAKGMTMSGQPNIDSEAVPARNVNTGRNGYMVSLDVTSLVNDWLADSTDNRGIAVVQTAGTLTSNAFWAGKANATATWRPTLVLDYTPVPEPTGLMLLAVGGGLLLIRRSRRAVEA